MTRWFRAAIDGIGVAIGRTPHNARHLRDRMLVAPLGREAVLSWGTYFVLVSPRCAQRTLVNEFVGWLREEVDRDRDGTTEAEVS